MKFEVMVTVHYSLWVKGIQMWPLMTTPRWPLSNSTCIHTGCNSSHQWTMKKSEAHFAFLSPKLLRLFQEPLDQYYTLIAFDERVTFWLQLAESLPCACAYALFARRLVYNHYAITHACNATNAHAHAQGSDQVVEAKKLLSHWRQWEYRLVCTHLNVFFMLRLIIAKQFELIKLLTYFGNFGMLSAQDIRVERVKQSKTTGSYRKYTTIGDRSTHSQFIKLWSNLGLKSIIGQRSMEVFQCRYLS